MPATTDVRKWGCEIHVLFTSYDRNRDNTSHHCADMWRRSVEREDMEPAGEPDVTFYDSRTDLLFPSNSEVLEVLAVVRGPVTVTAG